MFVETCENIECRQAHHSHCWFHSLHWWIQKIATDISLPAIGWSQRSTSGWPILTQFCRVILMVRPPASPATSQSNAAMAYLSHHLWFGSGGHCHPPTQSTIQGVARPRSNLLSQSPDGSAGTCRDSSVSPSTADRRRTSLQSSMYVHWRFSVSPSDLSNRWPRLTYRINGFKGFGFWKRPLQHVWTKVEGALSS